MTYQEYIGLDFERVETNCSVEFTQTGYHGFILVKKLNPSSCIEATSRDLDKPKLYINKEKGIDCHILPLTKEQIIQLLK